MVTDQGRTPLRGVAVTLEGRNGGAITSLTTGYEGEFRFGLLRPGDYQLLLEQQGFQPIRLTGILVSAGETTVLGVTLERRPPPIAAVELVRAPGTRVGSASGRLIGGRELELLDWRREASDALRGTSEVLWPTDGSTGFGLAASGLAARYSRLFVDGVLESPIRHPGLPGEPVPFTTYARSGWGQVRVVEAPLDAEWRGSPGSVVAAQTRSGTDRIVFSPFANAWSSALGGRAQDNPLDSTATSIQAGAVLSGAIVPDTAHFFVQLDYRSLQIPTAYPWERDASTWDGDAVSLRELVPAIGQDSFATPLARHVAPAVRTWKGASGMGKLDWVLSSQNRLDARVAFGAWKEQTPYLADLASLGTGATLTGRDVSAALALTTSTVDISNELRAGFTTTRRDFDASPLPWTALVSEGIAFGGSSALPAFFDTRTIDVSDALQLSFGAHRVKIGGNVTAATHQYDYRFGSAGLFRFGDLDRFGVARGSFYLAESSEIARFSTVDVGLFVQDSWAASPDLRLLAGLRWDVSPVPDNRISQATDWLTATGIRNDSVVTRYNSVSPRLGFVWDVRGEWVVRGGMGLHYGRLDPATFAEAMLYDGGVTVRRAIGTFQSWPGLPDDAIAPEVGPALTIINPTWRPPRSFKAELGFSRTMREGLALHVTGSYHHTDFLQRREDLNRVQDPLGTTQEGRPLYGALVREGGLLAPAVGSNRRFADFDLVSGLSPTGFVDHYEATISLVRQVSEGLSFAGSYTYSKTDDNLVGGRSIDPADQLSPFPDGLAGVDWDEGRSDFDVPHRAVATAEYATGGRMPVSIGGRYRVRSGLPFTPGFRPGVDANGDGSGGNDPAFLGGGVAGLAEALSAGGCPAGLGNQFAARNSCREKAAHSLDVHLSVGLPMGQAERRVWLEVDAFNVVATATGIIDKAAVLLDPAGTLLTDGAGNVTLPLIANPAFGSILARRGEPRVVRVGVRMEY